MQQNDIHPGNILIIDDEESIINAIKRQLRKSIHGLYFANAPDQALTILAEQAIDLIIIDIRMQAVQGVKFLEQLENQYPDILRIVLTGYTELNSVLDAVNKGRVYQYLTKPWEPIDLTTAITHAMRERISEQQRLQLHQELVKKNHALEKFSAERYEFFTKVNQEVHTVLHSANNMIDILAKTTLTSTQAEYLSMISDGNMGVMTILNDVLDLVSIEKNSIVLNNVDFYLDRVIEQAVEQAKSYSADQDIAIDYHIDPAVSRWFFADPSRIKQILNHLLSNAVNHTRSGYIRLEVGVTSMSENSADVMFTVSDSGCGIAPENRTALLQADSSIQLDVVSGKALAGIGLKLCCHLLKMMSSQLHCDSELGVGTSFYFNLPLEYGSASFENFKLSYNIVDLRIVCVGDAKEFRVIFKDLLDGVGSQKQFFDSNEVDDLLEQVKNSGCLIISNVIKHMDPFALIEKAKAVNPLIRIIMYAGKTYRGHSILARQAIVQGYLTRPFDKHILIDLIKVVMSLDEAKEYPLITRYIIHHIQLQDMHNTLECEGA